MRRGVATGEDSEIAGLELQDDGARDAGLFARGSPGFFREADDERAGFGEGQVAFKGVFGRDGLRKAAGENFAVVDAARQFVEAQTVAAETSFEIGLPDGLQVADSLYAELAEL